MYSGYTNYLNTPTRRRVQIKNLNGNIQGIHAVVYYTVSIFKATGLTIDSCCATIVIGVVQLLYTLHNSFRILYFLFLNKFVLLKFEILSQLLNQLILLI